MLTINDALNMVERKAIYIQESHEPESKIDNIVVSSANATATMSITTDDPEAIRDFTKRAIYYCIDSDRQAMVGLDISALEWIITAVDISGGEGSLTAMICVDYVSAEIWKKVQERVDGTKENSSEED